MSTTRTYVKTGLPGYGPDLDPEDVGTDPDDVRAICDDIRRELDILADMLEDSATAYADDSDFEAAWNAHKRAEELDVIRMNLDHERRQVAPIYAHGGAAGRAALDDTLRRIIAETFPLDVDNSTRLYVWDADDDDDERKAASAALWADA